MAGLVSQELQAAGYLVKHAGLSEMLSAAREGPSSADASISADEIPVERMFSQALAGASLPLNGFIYIASKDAGHKTDIFSDSEISALKTVFLCAKYFARMFKPETGPGFFVSAARIDGRLGLGKGGHAIQGGLFGLHKSVGIEWQGAILSKAVDLDPEMAPDKAARYLTEEILTAGYNHMEVGRPPDGGRCTLGLIENYPGADLRDKGPEHSDVLLITGGGRGITAQCAIRLAQSYNCGFILLGRTELNTNIGWAKGYRDRATLRKLAIGMSSAALKPSEVEKLVDTALHQTEALDTLSAIQAAGGRVRYAACDVRDTERLRDAIRACEAELGPVTGLVHGAGNIADKRIQRKTSEDFNNVFGSKIGGLGSCLRCINPGKLKYLILFSSIAGYFGNAGQSDYAMANEVMNKFAYAFKREHPACKAISINWGLWDGGSMASDSIRNAIKGSEIRLIPVETGTDYFIGQFAYKQKPGACQVVINCGDRLIRPDIGLHE